MSRVIFASHGDLAKGMLNSIKMIVGSLADNVETYCLYPGENPVDYYEILKKEIKDNLESVIILSDIKGGSVHTALSKLCIYPNVILFSGMNMNLSLEIIMSYQKGIETESFEKLLNTAKDGITILSNNLKESMDEDF